MSNGEQEYRFKMYGGDAIVKGELDLKLLYIEPTTRCNLSCKICFKQHWFDKEGDMDWNLFKKLIEESADFPKLRTVIFGGIGEPTVHPRIADMVSEAKKRGLKVAITTNGLFLSTSSLLNLVSRGIDSIYFSVDALPSSWNPMQHVGSKVVLDRIRALDKWRTENSKNLHIGAQIVVTKLNYMDIPSMVNLLRSMNVNEIIVSNILPTSKEHVELIVYDGSHDMKKIEEELSLLASRGARIRMPYFQLKTERRCLFDENNATVVRWDGEVSPCYRFLHSYKEYIFGREKKVEMVSFGNIREKSLKEIWLSRDYVRFRFVTRNYFYPSCTDCSLRDSCDFVKSSNLDCWGNSPSCADCLWARNLVHCPVPQI
ncbi:MAG: tungsten cofactor oxidoreductase radical SAM maturase [Fervidicoccaceae archaeon]